MLRAGFQQRVIVQIACSDTDCANGLVPLLDRIVDGGDLIPAVALPGDWHVIDGKPYCARHKVTIS